MSSTLSPAPADFWDKYHAERSAEVKLAPVDEREERSVGPLHRRRPLRAFFRFLITLGIGVGGTLAWQSYGDMAREMIANTYPQQLGWLMPQASSTVPAASAASAPAAPAAVGSAAPAAAADPQQLNAVWLGLAGARKNLEELATQVASDQQQMQQMAGEIAKLQASEQDILNKISTPRPAPARRTAPVPLTPPAHAAPAH